MISSFTPRAFCVFAFSVSVLAAQTVSPSGISGALIDSSGGAVVGAQVIATSQATSAQQTLLTDADGKFAFASAAPGAYSLAVTVPGFKAYTQAGVTVPATVSIMLEPAASSDSVDVSAKFDPFQVVPDTPTNSVFGIDTPLADIPRSISVVPSEMMTRYDIKTVNDLVAASPGSFHRQLLRRPGRAVHPRRSGR